MNGKGFLWLTSISGYDLKLLRTKVVALREVMVEAGCHVICRTTLDGTEGIFQEVSISQSESMSSMISLLGPSLRIFESTEQS